MKVTEACAEDCRAIAEVHVLSWQHAYKGMLPDDYLASLSIERREAMWRDAVANGRPQLLVAKRDSAVVGFIAFGPSRDPAALPDSAEVWAIYASPSTWSQGVGRLLWQAARERLAAQGETMVHLWVIADNQRALRFYSAIGFEPVPCSAKPFALGGAQLHEVCYAIRIDG